MLYRNRISGRGFVYLPDSIQYYFAKINNQVLIGKEGKSFLFELGIILNIMLQE